MALTYTIDFHGQANNVANAITSNTLSVLTGDWLDVVVILADDSFTTAWTVTNTGTGISWTLQQETSTASNCKVVHWSGIAGATPPTTVTVTPTAGPDLNCTKAICTIVHTGQHATTPLPAGNLFLLASGTDRSQTITPTSSGSCLWMVVGDWAETNSYAAGANCTLAATAYTDTGQMTAVPVRPTTQPRTDANAFTLAETDTSGTVIGIAFEVRAAAGGGPPATVLAGFGRRMQGVIYSQG